MSPLFLQHLGSSAGHSCCLSSPSLINRGHFQMFGSGLQLWVSAFLTAAPKPVPDPLGETECRQGRPHRTHPQLSMPSTITGAPFPPVGACGRAAGQAPLRRNPLGCRQDTMQLVPIKSNTAIVPYIPSGRGSRSSSPGSGAAQALHNSLNNE